MTIVTGCHSSGVVSFGCAQAGCRECLEALMQKHEGLVHAVIQKQGMGGIEYGELIQEGRIGLWHAIQHYDPGRGASFANYAWVVIRHQVWKATRRTSQEDGEGEAWLEWAEQIEEEWWRWHVRQALLEVVGKLPARLERLIHQIYGLEQPGPYSLAAIGRAWGISRQRVWWLHNQALVQLRLPALSQRLRSLCDQDSRAAYLQALAHNRAWQRSQRRRA